MFVRKTYTADIQQHRQISPQKISLLHAKNRAKIRLFFHIDKLFPSFHAKIELTDYSPNHSSTKKIAKLLDTISLFRIKRFY